MVNTGLRIEKFVTLVPPSCHVFYLYTPYTIQRLKIKQKQFRPLNYLAKRKNLLETIKQVLLTCLSWLKLITKNHLQNSTVTIVININITIKTNERFKFSFCAIFSYSSYRNVITRFYCIINCN